jgi:hypothetical protein
MNVSWKMTRANVVQNIHSNRHKLRVVVSLLEGACWGCGPHPDYIIFGVMPNG